MAAVAHRLEKIPISRCLELLGSQSLGRLAYIVGGKPQIRPLNYAVHQGSVTFRIGYGDTLDAIHLKDVVFEVDGTDHETQTGWSVIVRGIAEEIWRTDELAVARELGLESWAPGNRDHYVHVLSSEITGRRIA